MSYVPLAKEELVEVPTSSRWLAVSSELCFRYDSVYARPRRRNLETAVAAIVTATGPSDASRATTGAGRASATAIATATTAITRTKPPLQAHTLAPLAHSEQYTTKRTHGRREALGAAAAELTSHLY